MIHKTITVNQKFHKWLKIKTAEGEYKTIQDYLKAKLDYKNG